MTTPPTSTTRTSRPVAAGILSIVSEAASIIFSAGLLAFIAAVGDIAGYRGLVIGIIGIVLGIVAIIGGASAIRRRNRGLSPAGAIAAVVWPLGIAGITAVILLALSKHEFNK